jgi:hypothetical protein
VNISQAAQTSKRAIKIEKKMIFQMGLDDEEKIGACERSIMLLTS